MKRLYTAAEVGKHFGIDAEAVLRRCKSPVNPWPCIKVDRGRASTWRFSDDDIADIEARLTANRVPVDSWGREQKRGAVA